MAHNEGQRCGERCVPGGALGAQRLLFLSVEERVGLRGRGREMPGIGVKVTAGGLDGPMAEDALQHGCGSLS